MDYKLIKHFPDAETVKKWDVFLKNAELPTHYVTPNYFLDPFISGGERFAVLVSSGSQVVAVLTGLKTAKALQSGLGVRPQTAFLLGCDRDEAAEALTNGLAELAGEAVELINFYSWNPIPVSGFRYDSEQCAGADQVVMLDLSKGSEALFQEFSARRRAELRKIMKQQKLHVKQVETEAELNDFYEIHKEWNARKAFQPGTLESFQLALAQTANRRIFIAVSDGKIIAGSIFRFCKGGVVEYAANNSTVGFEHLEPNKLLVWSAIEWACSSGFSHFSLGGSHQFLAKFGGELVGAYRHRLDRTFLRRHEKRERMQRFAIKIYLRLPGSVRKRIKLAAAKISLFKK